LDHVAEINASIVWKYESVFLYRIPAEGQPIMKRIVVERVSLIDVNQLHHFPNDFALSPSRRWADGHKLSGRTPHCLKRCCRATPLERQQRRCAFWSMRLNDGEARYRGCRKPSLPDLRDRKINDVTPVELLRIGRMRQ
jgi:hypothetical protein